MFNHCLKCLEHPAISVVLLILILFLDTSISALLPPESTFIIKKKIIEVAEKSVLPNPLRRFVVNQQCSKGGRETAEFALEN